MTTRYHLESSEGFPSSVVDRMKDQHRLARQNKVGSNQPKVDWEERRVLTPISMKLASYLQSKGFQLIVATADHIQVKGLTQAHLNQLLADYYGQHEESRPIKIYLN